MGLSGVEAGRIVPPLTGWRRAGFTVVLRMLCLAAGLLACGCAHHRTNQYAYAPPLMPPVYPQPQTAAQPVMVPAGAVPGPVIPGAMPAGMAPGVVPPGAAPMVSQPWPASAALPPMEAGVVPALADGSCPPCAAGQGGTMPVVYEGGMQTTPCPPGP